MGVFPEGGVFDFKKSIGDQVNTGFILYQCLEPVKEAVKRFLLFFPGQIDEKDKRFSKKMVGLCELFFEFLELLEKLIFLGCDRLDLFIQQIDFSCLGLIFFCQLSGLRGFKEQFPDVRVGHQRLGQCL